MGLGGTEAQPCARRREELAGPFSTGRAFHERGIRELDLRSTEQRRLRRDLVSAYKYLHPTGWCQISSLVPSDRKKNNGYKLKYKKLHFNIRKNFVSRVAEHWNRLAGRSCSFPLSRHSNPTWTRFVSPGPSDPALAGGLN